MSKSKRPIGADSGHYSPDSGAEGCPLYVEGLIFRAHAAALDVLDDFVRGDGAGVGDVVGAEGDAFFPAGEGGGDEFPQF